MRRLLFTGLCLLLLACQGCCQSSASYMREAEHLDRGLIVSVSGEQKAFLSWRLLIDDKASVAFDVYKRVEGEDFFTKLNAKALRGGTNFCDENYDNSKACDYLVMAAGNHAEQMPAEQLVAEAGSLYHLEAHQPQQSYLSIPLQTPEGYRPGDCSLGDLDGDGRYEIIVKQESQPRDNSHAGFTGQSKLEAYTLDGQMLWRADLGINIREGAHYIPFLVFDFDGDGKAEVVCKTADGTIDGQGNVLGDATADWRNKPEDRPAAYQGKFFEGVIMRGPEYLSVFDGETGAIKANAKYIPSRHPEKENPSPQEMSDIWSDGYGNRSERYLACVAYLDSKRPSIVMCRGYYSRTVLAAWNYEDGQLIPVWTFDSDDKAHPEHFAYRGMGNHNLSVGDVDGDGFDEIVYGNMVVDHDGKGLYSTGIGHADAMHLSDLDPERPGLEIFNTQEPVGAYGMNFRQAGSGEIYWNVPTDSVAVSYERKQQGPGRAVAFDIDERYPGAECWVRGGGISGLYNCKGEKIAERAPRSCNFAIYWDGDLLRELLDGTRIQKYHWQDQSMEMLLQAEGCRSNNGSKSTPSISADIYGDWREEVVFPTRDNKELRIYTTTIPTDYRMPSLMYDPIYRLGIAWQNVGYNIPPHLSVDLVSKFRK